MKLPRWTVLDFETKAIQQRPEYPPEPVGVAIKRPGERKYPYYAWGHPTENNCTKEEAFERIRDVINNAEAILCQEAKFDIDVAVKHVPGCRMPSWDRVHDTKFMIFLNDPHADNLSLKPSAQRILGMAPEEQDAVRDWVLKNVRGAKKSDWGAYISLAPGKLVGKYGSGDIIRTEKLANHLYPLLDEAGMIEAYDRERRLMPKLLENEQQGIRMDLLRLERDVPIFQDAIVTCDAWLAKKLKVKDLNVDSDQEFAEALAQARIVADEDWVLTPSGKRSVSKKNLTKSMFKDQKVFQVFNYRNKLSTYVGTFLTEWLEQARRTGGLAHTTWRQVKAGGGGGDDSGGARSGRCQSSPNFQNIPADIMKREPDFKAPEFLKVPPLPRMRSYYLPDGKNQVWGRRDYNQQELRILAHFESGRLLANYLDNPRYDMHKLVQDGLKAEGMDFPRTPVKMLNFQDIYGGGLEAFMRVLNCDLATAKRVKAAKAALMPDVAALREAINQHSKNGYPINTWGGRVYYVEPPKYVEKFRRHMTFEYKLLNYLIQGSAADCTKEAIIRYCEHPKRQGRLLVTVHDELNISADKKVFKQEMALLREVMQSVEFDIPMLSDGEFGPDWGTLEKFDEPEFDIKRWKKERGVK